MAKNQSSYTFESTFSAECHNCGQALAVEGVSIDRENDTEVIVGYCDKCAETSYNEGYDEGLEAGEAGAKEELQPTIDDLTQKLAEAESLLLRVFRSKK